MNSKRIIAAVLAGIVCLAASGCGSQPSTKMEEEQTKLVFWHTWNDEDLKHDIEEVYNKENKDNINVEFKVVTGDYRQSVDLAVMSGNVPDTITAVGPSQVRTLAAKQNIVPLTNYLTKELMEQYEPGFETKIDGVTYGVSGTSYIRRMLYNADLFREAGLDPDKPPKTLDEMLQYARTITEKGAGQYYGMAMPLAAPDLIRTQLVYRVAVPTIGATGGYDNVAKRYDFNVFAPILKKLQTAYNDKVFLPGSATLNMDQEAIQFAAGKVGMTILTSGFATRFGVLDDLSYDFDMRSCDIPAMGDEIKYHHVVESPGAQVIMAGGKHQDETWKFAEWLMSIDRAKKTQRVLYSEVPFNKEVIANQEKYFKKSPTSSLFKIDMNDYVSETLVDEPANLELQGDNDSKTFTNIILSNLDVDATLNEMTQRYNAALDKLIADGKCNVDDYYFSAEEHPLLLK